MVNNTLYMVTPFPNYLIALDLTKPGYPMKWMFDPNPDQRAVGIACCDLVNRGASYADGKIIYNTLDDQHLRGRCQYREARLEDAGRRHQDLGETITMAPIVVKNVSSSAIVVANLGVRGKLTALDLKAGKIFWRAYNSGPDTDARSAPASSPFTRKIKEKIWG